MSFWLADPELFLYAKGIDPDDVHLCRCKKPESSSSSSSSLVVPMESDDFDYVRKVENHVDLIGDMFNWDEPDYKRLVKYIYEKRLLVNGQGFVIARVLHEADKEGNKKIDDANEEEEEEDVAAIYIRSLDVLPLKSYIPMLRERPIPLRTVKYLGDVNGKAALMEVDSQVTKLTTRVENLEIGDTRLEADNKTLKDKVTKLTADQATQMSALTTLQRQLNRVLQINPDYKMEVWMNDLTNSEWVGPEGIQYSGTNNSLTVVGQMGAFTVDDGSTNIMATYCYKTKFIGNIDVNEYKSVCLEDLPNKENARFTQKNWISMDSNGKKYALRVYRD